MLLPRLRGGSVRHAHPASSRTHTPAPLAPPHAQERVSSLVKSYARHMAESFEICHVTETRRR
eukprot:341086-Rhodomonas_salina.1